MYLSLYHSHVPEKTSVNQKFKSRGRVECKVHENLSMAVSLDQDSGWLMVGS